MASVSFIFQFQVFMQFSINFIFKWCPFYAYLSVQAMCLFLLRSDVSRLFEACSMSLVATCHCMHKILPFVVFCYGYRARQHLVCLTA
jgi:hypothetical protein